MGAAEFSTNDGLSCFRVYGLQPFPSLLALLLALDSRMFQNGHCDAGNDDQE
jgi:hypothetical protein